MLVRRWEFVEKGTDSYSICLWNQREKEYKRMYTTEISISALLGLSTLNEVKRQCV